MEHKKILWIFVTVGGFVLILLVVMLILYAPSRSTGLALQQTAAVSTKPETQSQIDPDSWVREPDTAPGLDNSVPPSPGNINLTIVNGDNAGANYGTMDVSNLTKGNPNPINPDSTIVLPGTDTSGQAENKTTAKPAVEKESAVKSAKTETKADPVKAPAKSPTQAAAVKPAAPKTVTVTEYWIQTGSFASKLNAEKARDSLTARYLKAEIFTKEVSGATTFRVRVGPYKSKTEADYWLGTVKEVPDFTGSYVSEVKTKK